MADDSASSSGSEPRPHRPRPRYGEYATPQDQANAIASSLPPVSPALRPGPVSAPAPDPATRLGDIPADPAHGADAGTTAPPGGTALSGDTATSAGPDSQAAPRRFDLILSVGFLVYGFLNVLSGLFQYVDLGGYLDQFYRTLGIGDYAGGPADRPIGILIAASNVISFALAAWFTARRLRRGKLAFWIPLVAGAIAALVSTALLMTLLAGDPALTRYVEGLLAK